MLKRRTAKATRAARTNRASGATETAENSAAASSPQAFRGARVALLLGVTFLCIAGMELVVRALQLAPQIGVIELDTPTAAFVSSPNPELRYVPRAGASDINSYGIRDHDYPVERGPGSFRAVVLGDSIGFGYCTWSESLEIDALFPNVLERALQQDHPEFTGVDIINLSVSGYSTVQELAFFEEKGAPLDPDLVIVAYCMNDDVTLGESGELAIFRRQKEFGAARAMAASIERNALLRSELIRAIWFQFGQISEAYNAKRVGDSGDKGHPARVASAFARLQEMGEAQDFETLIVLFPHLHLQKNGEYTVADRHRVVAEIAVEHGLHVLDLLPIFMEKSGGVLPRVAGRCQAMHPDEAGHRLTAGVIRDYLAEHRLVVRRNDR